MKPETVQISTYWKNGMFLTLREALPLDHPENLYNHFKTQYPDLEPEDYGIFHPLREKYKDWTREALMSKICDLEIQLSKIHESW